MSDEIRSAEKIGLSPLNVKKPYRQPQLTVYGTLRDLTQNANNNHPVSDNNGQGNDKKTA
jgi:hypothetical protein